VRIVIDCNVLISGFIWPGTPNQLLNELANSTHELFVSDALLAEFQRVLDYPKIKKSIIKANLDANLIMDGYRKRCLQCYPVPLPAPVCRDPNDDHVLACALSANADMMISGDDDLLSLKEYQGISILSPADALQLLQRDS